MTDQLRTCAWSRAARKKARRVEIDPGNLQLVANKPVSFRLYSSLTRTEDKPGEVVEFRESADGDLHLHAPLERRDPLRQRRASGWFR